MKVGSHSILVRMRRWATFLDSSFTIPGTTIRIGWDPIIGLIPGIGDWLTALASLLIVLNIWRTGIPAALLAHMLFNILVEVVCGPVPVIGDIIDVYWKANIRNVDLFEDFLSSQEQKKPHT